MGDPNRLLPGFDRPGLAKRHWVLSFAELRAAGLSPEEIEHRERIGYLHRRFRGVYAVGRPDLGFPGSCRAAWLASGEGSAVSHVSAAAYWGIRRSSGRIHVSIPRGRRGHPGLHVHRPRSLPLEDIVHRDGLGVTSVARTLLDMAPGQRPETVGKWIHEAGVQRVLDLREIWAVLERNGNHRGRVVLEAALHVEVAPTRSELEELLLSVWRRAGLPKPVVNGFLWSGAALEEVDAHSPELALIVEADGARYHASRWRRRRDAAKDERFRAAGWVVERVPELDLVHDPAGVAARLRQAAAAVGRSKPSAGRLR